MSVSKEDTFWRKMVLPQEERIATGKWVPLRIVFEMACARLICINDR
jgi:hypothetical protein